MLWNLLTAVLGMVIVMGAWLALQAAARKQSERGSDKDALEYMAHGCAGCTGSGACHNRPDRDREEASAKEAHHEPI